MPGHQQGFFKKSGAKSQPKVFTFDMQSAPYTAEEKSRSSVNIQPHLSLSVGNDTLLRELFKINHNTAAAYLIAIYNVFYDSHGNANLFVLLNYICKALSILINAEVQFRQIKSYEYKDWYLWGNLEHTRNNALVLWAQIGLASQGVSNPTLNSAFIGAVPEEVYYPSCGK